MRAEITQAGLRDKALILSPCLFIVNSTPQVTGVCVCVNLINVIFHFFVTCGGCFALSLKSVSRFGVLSVDSKAPLLSEPTAAIVTG